MSEFTDAYVNLLIKQYWEKTNAPAEIAAQAATWEKIRDLFNEFGTRFDLDVAVGAQLDIIGEIVGISRFVPFDVANSYWSQVGEGLTIPLNPGASSIAALNSTDIAFIDANLDQLRTYQWDGSTWSQIGSGLAIVGTNVPSITALNSTDVAFIDSANDQLRTYRWNGSTWSLVGSGLVIATVGSPALATLNSTDIALIDNGNDELRTYRFNGSTWSQVGSGLSVGPLTGVPILAALNSTDVAFIDGVTDELRTYRFNGTTWSLVGSALSISCGGGVGLTALNSTDVAFSDGTNEQLRTYRFDGAVWSQVGSGLSIPGIEAPKLTLLTDSTIAFVDSTLDRLATYRWHGTSPLELTDEEYRFFIKVKIAVNTASAYMVSDSRTSIQDVINTVFAGDAYVVDNKGMSLDLYIPASYDLNQLALILALDLLPKPQGVRYATIIQAIMGETFGFADNPNSRGFANKDDLINEPGGVFALKVI